MLNSRDHRDAVVDRACGVADKISGKEEDYCQVHKMDGEGELEIFAVCVSGLERCEQFIELIKCAGQGVDDKAEKKKEQDKKPGRYYRSGCAIGH